MRTRSISLVSTVLAAAALVLPVSVACSSPATAAVFGPGAVTNSTQLTTTPLFSGSVANSTGVRVPGVSVTLYAIPPETPGSDLALGNEIILSPLAWTRTGTFGDYSLRLPATSDLSPFADHGIVHFVIKTNGPDSSYEYHQDRVATVSAATGQTAFSAVDPADALTAGTPDPSATTTVAVSLDSTTAATLPDATPSSPIPCAYRKLADLGARVTTVGGYYSATSKVIGSGFKMTAGNTATLGVAVSTTGGIGSWKASGTQTVVGDASASLASPPSGLNAYAFRTAYVYGKYKWTCSLTSYEVRPTGGWSGTISKAVAGLPTATYCAPTDAVTFTRNSGKNKTFAAGVQIKAALGNIDLSSKSGWSSKVSQTWKISRPATLCGSTGGAGSASPGYIVVKS